MHIKDIKALSGPNYWSIKRHQLIVMLLDIEELEEQPTNLIPHFYERLKDLMPSLYGHRCSEGEPGGFFTRVKEGTWMGHVIEHIALELQSLAGMETGFGRTRSTGSKGLYHVVFSYADKEAGIYAAKAAVAIADALIKGEAYNIEQDIQQLKTLHEANRFGPSTYSIVHEAAQRGIPVLRLNEGSYVQLGYGCKQKKIEATIAITTSSIAVELVGDKHKTKQILTDSFVPVPEGEVVSDVNKLEVAIRSIGFPIVMKPLDGNQGKGATTNINSLKEAMNAFHLAKKISDKVVVERYIQGSDFRALVINYKFIAAAKRTPASIKGDGMHTIQQLIDIVNSDPRRGNGHCNVLSKIVVDQATQEILEKKGLTLETVLPRGEELWLKTTANLSTGGTSEDVTDYVHPANVSLFERIARVVGLDICGIDIIAPHLHTPLIENGGAVIEVNAAPGFRMHLRPTTGQARNVAAPVVDMLFPDGSNGRIPIIAITGTNGKTTTTRLIAQMAQQAGYNTGFTTTDGIYVNKELIFKGDCSGPASAEALLRDPAIEFAVLETARGGILRSGLAFDTCNCAVITNVAEDHLGLNGIDTIEKLAKVKSVVAESVMPDGYAILNADDDLVYAMKDNVSCKVALFSMYADNIRIQQHCEKGGLAAFFEQGFILIREGNRIIAVDEVHNIPITFGGMARFNVMNVLGATLAAYVSGITMPAIRSTLRNFRHSTETTPGRMNEFKFNDFTIMVDYAHNPHGLRAFGEFVKALPASKKVGVITGVGDRRSEDIIALGEEAAKIFDEIIIRQDNDLRGRTAIEISSLLRSGIQKVAPHKKITYFANEMDATDYAINTASPNSYTVIFVDKVTEVCKRVQQFLDNEKNLQQKITA